MTTLDSRVDEVAQEIANWEAAQQENLLKKLVDLNYRHGLKELSERIQNRLRAEGKLDQSVEEIFAELAQERESITKSELYKVS